MGDVAIIVHTCDKYKFCWEGWEYYFNRFWDFSFPAPIYFVNEEVDVHFSFPIKQIKTGIGKFSDCLASALDQIPEKHIFYIQEDAWLQQTLDLKWIYDTFCQLDMNCLRICEEQIVKTEIVSQPQMYRIEGVMLRKLDLPTPFLISHLPGFWKKDFFASTLLPGQNPWECEEGATLRLQGGDKLPSDHREYSAFYSYDPDKLVDFKIYVLWKLWYYSVCDRGTFNYWGHLLLERMNNVKRCCNCPYNG